MAPLAAVIPNSYMGELTPGMAEAIASSDAIKILLPLGQFQISFVGVDRQPIPHLMEEALAQVKQQLGTSGEVKSDV